MPSLPRIAVQTERCDHKASRPFAVFCARFYVDDRSNRFRNRPLMGGVQMTRAKMLGRRAFLRVALDALTKQVVALNECRDAVAKEISDLNIEIEMATLEESERYQRRPVSMELAG